MKSRPKTCGIVRLGQEATFKSEVLCPITREAKTVCVVKDTTRKECIDCARDNGIASQRTVNLDTGASVNYRQCEVVNEKLVPIKRSGPKIGRNDMCTCEENLKLSPENRKKWKNCCGMKC